jgi:hypothetical protein
MFPACFFKPFFLLLDLTGVISEYESVGSFMTCYRESYLVYDNRNAEETWRTKDRRLTDAGHAASQLGPLSGQ